MQAHDTLPQKLKSYLKNEQISVSYLDLKESFWFLYKENIWVNKSIHFYKKRFTIAHELWHHFYGHQNRSYLFWKFFKNYDEKKADEFALQSLLPKSKLLEEAERYNWDLTILEKVFWVEMFLIEKRIKQLF